MVRPRLSRADRDPRAAEAPSGAFAPPAGEAALRVAGVERHFGEVAAVAGVDVAVAAGEFVTLLGPSGCGKSTLLRMIAGIETPDAGSIAIGGREVFAADSRLNVAPERRGLGMVFQSYAVWPHMTVEDNVGYPLRRRRMSSEERRAKVAEVLDAVRLFGVAKRYPGQLSGGQQQRVALARAIVHRPSLLLLDEPLSNLDARLRDEMRLELKRLQVDLGLSMLYVTHDQSEALAMSDRILVMSAGRVIQAGTPEEVYRRPETLEVARFLGFKNILEGEIGGPETVHVAGRQVRPHQQGRPQEQNQHLRPDERHQRRSQRLRHSRWRSASLHRRSVP